MSRKVLILVNPKAGKAKIKKDIQEIEENLKRLNYGVVTKYTTKRVNGTEVIRNYDDDYDILIICGGDGTLNEATQGLYEMKKKVFVGFIPTGTTNDFAKSLKVSFNKMDISTNINKYNYEKVDQGLFNERVFNYSATFGVFSKVSYRTSTKWKNKVGRLAYLGSATKEIFNIKPYKMNVYTDEKNIEDEFIFGSVSNSNYIGGFNMFKDEEIKLNDGKFEVVLVKKPKNILDTAKAAIKIINGNFEDENIYYFKTSKIEMESEEQIDWSLDGEFGGKKDKVKIHNMKESIEYIMPRKTK